MKKGFTLMEILAVILIMAVIVSLAVPVLREARFEFKQSQAKAAALKMAQAIHNLYHDSRGAPMTDACFTPMNNAGRAIMQSIYGGFNSSGVPFGKLTPGSLASDLASLFGSGYLMYKDFEGIPYTFCTYKPEALGNTNPTGYVAPYRVVAYGNDAQTAGSKYTSDKGYIYVDGRMKVLDTYE